MTRGHHEGSVYRRADGRWVATIDLGHQDGRRRRKSFYAGTRAAVAEQLHQALRDHQVGLPVRADERLTTGAYLEQWLAAAQPTMRPRTWQGYALIVRRHWLPAVGRVPLTRLTPGQVQAVLNAKIAAGAAAQTVRNVHAVLRRALNRAVRDGILARNVSSVIDLPQRVAHEAPTISPELARAILAAVSGDSLDALVTLVLASGLRQGEALALRWSDVDLDAGSLTVRRTLLRMGGVVSFSEPKTPRSRRTLALPAGIVSALRAHRARQAQRRLWSGSRWVDGDLVFTSSIGTPLTGGDVTKRFQALLAAAGLPRMRFHDLSHGCASLLLTQGIHPRVVMEQLGHSTIALTMNTYSHVIPALQRDAADRMDAMLRPG
jgi:integrase